MTTLKRVRFRRWTPSLLRRGYDGDLVSPRVHGQPGQVLESRAVEVRDLAPIRAGAGFDCEDLRSRGDHQGSVREPGVILATLGRADDVLDRALRVDFLDRPLIRADLVQEAHGGATRDLLQGSAHVGVDELRLLAGEVDQLQRGWIPENEGGHDAGLREREVADRFDDRDEQLVGLALGRIEPPESLDAVELHPDDTVAAAIRHWRRRVLALR